MILDMIWSHCRNIHVYATRDIVKYTVPIYSEKEWIGKIKSINVKENDIVIEFYKKKELGEALTEIKEKNKFLTLQ
jgi:hypothetical protein